MKLFLVVNEDRFFLSHRKDIALRAQNEGFDVTIVCKDTGHHDVILKMGLNVVELPVNPTGMNLREELSTYQFLKNLYKKERPDIVHHVGLKNILWGGLAAKRAKVPSVVNAVSGLGVLFGQEKLSSTAKWILRFMCYNNKRNNVVEIFQNHADMELFLRYGVIDKPRCEYIKGSGVNLQEYYYSREPLDGKIRVLFTGRMVKEKGALTLIDAADMLRDEYAGRVEFLLCGGLTNNPAGIKQDELQRRCDKSYIQWLGHRRDIKELLQSSHIVAFPSYYREGVPRSLIEACSAGRPIITCDAIGCRDAVDNGKNGFLISPQNASELASRLITLIENPRLRQEMGLNGRRKAEKEFDIQHVIDRHIQIYNTLAANM